MKNIIIIGLVILVGFLFIQSRRGDVADSSDGYALPFVNIMEVSSFTPVSETPEPFLEDSIAHLAPIVDESVHADGTWTPDTTIEVGDTVPIVVDFVQIEDTRWVKVTIDGKLAEIRKAVWFEKERPISRWSVGLECSLFRGGDGGMDVGYRLFNLSDIKIEAAGVVDIRQDIAQTPRWIAVELRGSKSFWESAEAGLGIGSSLSGDGPAWHISLGVGIRF